MSPLTPTSSPGSRPELVCFQTLAACDGAGHVVRPAALLVEFAGSGEVRVLAVDRLEAVRHHPAFPLARSVELANSILIPGLVNAHTHLDLTHIGPQPHDAKHGFVRWVDMVRARRHSDPSLIADSVKRGVELSLKGGVVAVGDIAGAPAGMPNLTPYGVLRDSAMWGVSYLEFFGIGASATRGPERIEAVMADAPEPTQRVRLGLQPHAPNTVDLLAYRWAREFAEARRMPLSTHLAETAEEREFVERGTGPQRAFLERMGLWSDAILERIGKGKHPVQHLARVLSGSRFLVAHVNDADDAAIETLASTGTSVAYCPRASAYFGAELTLGPHRYRDMLRAGVNITLGTDSIVNLPSNEVEANGISTLDEMQFLWRRDGTDPLSLLRMGTGNGAAALGLDAGHFEFRSGGTMAGVVAIEVGPDRKGDDPLAWCLASTNPPALLGPRHA